MGLQFVQQISTGIVGFHTSISDIPARPDSTDWDLFVTSGHSGGLSSWTTAGSASAGGGVGALPVLDVRGSDLTPVEHMLDTFHSRFEQVQAMAQARLNGCDYLLAAGGDDGLGAGHDVLAGAVGTDRVGGAAGNDAMLGRSGNDTLIGGGGHDRIWGCYANDLIVVGLGRDTVSGGGRRRYLRLRSRRQSRSHHGFCHHCRPAPAAGDRQLFGFGAQHL
ncbi:MAG: hypothetical protein CSA72_00325 [Rhodobacterales bacterium]|nr:MAG: hypothetical protein CSA72_00325 [Rhodobacterales bacterium]